MSLEAVTQENTAALKEHTEVMKALLARLTAGAITTPAAEKPVATPKSVPAASPAPSKPTATAVADAAPEKTASASSPAAESAAAAPPASTAAPATYDQVKPLILKINTAKGREAALAALAKFGVDKGPDLKPEQFAEFIEYANEVLK